jgi:predicted aldo/keto reductase-like oxidoreductase
MADVFNNKLKLGFGLMRLPKNPDGSIDIPQVCEMTDHFIAAGGTYFDTAYVYDNGGSEAAFKAAVADRYPREAYTVATKLNASMQCHDEESAKQQFYTSLERTGAGYFDYYLLHALQVNTYQKYDEYHIWDFVKEQKEKGLIRHWGFSFHAYPELLDQLLTDHPDAEFVQLQINYADWENPGVASRRNWEICKAHGKPVVVMEPVKGGTLVKVPEAVKESFLAEDSTMSVASWAIRFAASLPNVMVVLSGMSSLEQLRDNTDYMGSFIPLSEEEKTMCFKAAEIINRQVAIPCTACSYCTEGCPMHICIPSYFSIYNEDMREHLEEKGWTINFSNYGTLAKQYGKASDCIACGQCESVCPQGLPVISLLRKCREELEK